jgi:hypothetical protein
MNHHDFAIASRPHVEFAHIGAKLSGGDERAQSVFRIKNAGSAMRDRQHFEQHRARRHKSSPTTLIEGDFTRHASQPANPCTPALHRLFLLQAFPLLVKLRDDPYA